MYALLCNYASDNDRCWPSQAKLAARLSCSVSSVKKYLAELVGIKLVHVRREQYRSSVYYMLEPAHMKGNSSEATKSDSQAAKPTCRQADSACPQPKVGYINTLNKQREIQNPPLPPVRSALPDFAASPLPSVSGGGGVSVSNFEKVWELYPKKEAKGLARSAWLRLQREGLLPPLPRIEASIRHFMASETWQREQGRFVPQMSNWLMGQRWLDDAVMTAAKETEARERSAAALQAMQQKAEARRAAMDKEREALRPRFEAFAEKFHLHVKPWIRPMAFGLWMHLHSAHRAPAPSDVPENNTLDIIEFLKAFRQRCEERAWRASPARERRTQAMPGVFSVPSSEKPLTCGNILRHIPVFPRQPASQAFAKSI